MIDPLSIMVRFYQLMVDDEFTPSALPADGKTHLDFNFSRI